MGKLGASTTNQPEGDQRKWWQTGNFSPEKAPNSHVGQPCPYCFVADLDLDTLFRVSCPNCGYVADCGAFT